MLFNGMAGKGIRDLSAAYDHVGLPAGPAFSIWGIIFTWELVFVIGQFFVSGFDEILSTLTFWFCISQLMQGLWVVIFTKTDPNLVGHGGDAWLWASIVLLLATPAAWLQVVDALTSTAGVEYWISFGMTINAAWVLLAAGLTVNQAARAIGLEGAPLSAVALVVLACTVCLEAWITGLIGENRFNSPLAFFPVATWALLWVFSYLNTASPDTDPHRKRILPLYGSNFISFYKWSALILGVAFVGLELKLCTM